MLFNPLWSAVFFQSIRAGLFIDYVVKAVFKYFLQVIAIQLAIYVYEKYFLEFLIKCFSSFKLHWSLPLVKDNYSLHYFFIIIGLLLLNLILLC